jgi:hypothetical protein
LVLNCVTTSKIAFMPMLFISDLFSKKRFLTTKAFHTSMQEGYLHPEVGFDFSSTLSSNARWSLNRPENVLLHPSFHQEKTPTTFL